MALGPLVAPGPPAKEVRQGVLPPNQVTPILSLEVIPLLITGIDGGDSGQFPPVSLAAFTSCLGRRLLHDRRFGSVSLACRGRMSLFYS